MFAKMCRAARIPCLLVNGKAKGGSYQPGDVDNETDSADEVISGQTSGDHGGKTARLVAFQIVCDHVPLETLPFPSYPENGFGFGEAAVAAGLSEPSHTEGFVPVKSGDKISIHFKVSIDSAILARLVHSTRTPEQLRANVIVEREDDNATVIATLPADDPEPEYSLEVDSVKIIKETDESITELPSYHVLNYLLTSDKALSAVITDKKKILQWYEDVWSSIINNDSGRLEEVASKVETACITNPMLEKRIRTKKTGYRRMVQELLDCKREMNFERLNRALSRCIAANLQKKDDIEEGKKVLMYLCQKEVEKAVKGNKLEELNACMNKIKHTCVGEAAQQKAWFKEAEKVLSKLEVGQQAMTQSLRTKDDVNVRKPPDHVMDVIVAAFILLGESEDELDTWEKVDAKLRKTNEEQLLNQVSNLNNSSLTRERVDLAKRKMEQAGGTFAEYRTIETLKKQDKELWELEDWYPPLCPPETLKEDLLRDVDFTEVEKDARAKLDSPKDSFDELVQHLTSHLSSDLHKLRAIFVWMKAQNIGFRQETGSCGDNNSPECYLQEASKDDSLIGKMFAKMCRAARIPCVLVDGKAKCTTYEPGDVDIAQNTWAVVYVANSWRFNLYIQASELKARRFNTRLAQQTFPS
ncbi:hypothetical protein C0Q70_18106 [Pomacea canaliculata]|uniref:Transglutaminase-like domain-containing protein n=1 Tax=Pomacea canaliculata TaxID=400727 RepID=A0A2T7NM93_POMCA|nr:hypothetical protein C0Q70_18106 [Pomacea canaliculata]